MPHFLVQIYGGKRIFGIETCFTDLYKNQLCKVLIKRDN